jgi:hypothetical protein
MFPTVVLFICMGAIFAVCVGVASKTTGDHGLTPFEFIDQNAWMLQVVLVVLSMVFAFLVAALQPTFTRAIANVVFAFVVYFVGCGLVVCPYAMPMMLPDKTGTVALIWQICGYIKCMVVIAVLIYSVCQHPPRRVLRVLEWTLMIVIVAIGLFVAMSCVSPLVKFNSQAHLWWRCIYFLTSHERTRRLGHSFFSSLRLLLTSYESSTTSSWTTSAKPRSTPLSSRGGPPLPSASSQRA